MTENEKASPSEHRDRGSDDASAEFVRDLATSAPPKSVETVKAASDVADPEARVRRRAYELWEQDGCQDGKHEHYWLVAEREIANESEKG